MTIELPPLPEAQFIKDIGDYRDFYTPDQMCEYAHACVNAALEQAEQKCGHIAQVAWDKFVRDPRPSAGGYSNGADKCVEAIRAMKKEQK